MMLSEKPTNSKISNLSDNSLKTRVNNLVSNGETSIFRASEHKPLQQLTLQLPYNNLQHKLKVF